MADVIIRCHNCGAECSPNEDYCRRCYAQLSQARDVFDANSDETLNGIPVSDYHEMIEINAARYLGIFRKNENKRVFLHTNWSAFFFSIYWFFYRKMYLYGVLSLLVSVLISIAAILLSVLVFRGEILELRAIQSQYESMDISVSDYSADDLGEVIEYQTEVAPKLDALTGKMLVLVCVVYIVMYFVCSLFADCLYRRYLLTKGRETGGGVSGISIVAAIPIVAVANFITEMLSPAILAWIQSLVVPQ